MSVVALKTFIENAPSRSLLTCANSFKTEMLALLIALPS